MSTSRGSTSTRMSGIVMSTSTLSWYEYGVMSTSNTSTLSSSMSTLSWYEYTLP